jgi:hypothetical protein
VPVADLAIYQPRFNSVVVPADRSSQSWITVDPSTLDQRAFVGDAGGTMSPIGLASAATMYLSFDTPVGAKSSCGRAV